MNENQKVTITFVTTTTIEVPASMSADFEYKAFCAQQDARSVLQKVWDRAHAKRNSKGELWADDMMIAIRSKRYNEAEEIVGKRDSSAAMAARKAIAVLKKVREEERTFAEKKVTARTSRREGNK